MPWSACAFGAITTPATRVVSAAALRPFSGSSLTCCSPMTWDSVPVVVSTCGALFHVDRDFFRSDLQGHVERKALVRLNRNALPARTS